MNNLEGKGFAALRDSNTTKDHEIQERRYKDKRKEKEILNPWTAYYSRQWNTIFLASCVIGVFIDPFFLYIPIVNDDQKCLTQDFELLIVSLVLRSVTDFSYVLHIIFRLKTALAMSKKLDKSIFTGLPWPYLLLNVLAFLPLPQVVFLLFFSKITGLQNLVARWFINTVLLLQYAPRTLHVYLLAKELGRAFDSLSKRVVRGAFLFMVYIISSHVFGAFWYFYSIVAETRCWHKACEKLTNTKECDPGPFDCRHNHPMKTLTNMDQYCPNNPPNATVFDYGIFTQAIESRMITEKQFREKFFQCFWWGLSNLSSFGQNLDTSSSIPEICFAILISALGLLFFLYLIGNLQTYMQLETTKSEEIRRKTSIIKQEVDSFLLIPYKEKFINEKDIELEKAIKRYITLTIREGKDFNVEEFYSLIKEDANPNEFAAWVTKILGVKKYDRNTTEQKAELWISKNELFDENVTSKIKKFIQLRFQEGKEVDNINILHVLPFSLGMYIKKHLCFPILKRVPLFQNMDEYAYETICKYLKPVKYSEKSYIIRKGEPLDMILFITQGVVWAFGNETTPMSRLQKGDFYGNELIEWRLKSTSIDEFPISVANLKSHTNVEALALMAIDLEHVLSNCWFKFSRPCSSIPEGLKPFAVDFLQQLMLRWVRRRRKKVKESQSGEVSLNML
ncbi:cyclic nucleotide-gated ion channel 1-like isoform X1 [Humulus lupulus]|uniref:cyclic nucleotide-gated ion channel 1-like isoform X1 n=1 Tax=Humulus lupulus TaxID=3486 RepID=UPI002B4094A3|nr:cyclic nucleotide-gated ion channel 1-like isoform X1 [Humulus lupulus]